jgi:ribosome-binding factor A
MSNNNFDRHDRVSSLITELAASFVQNEANTNPLITVTRTTTSPDYKKVSVHVTTIPAGEEAETNALIFLKRHASAFRSFIKKKSSLKTIPHVDFVLDVGERHRQHIDEVVKGIEG